MLVALYRIQQAFQTDELVPILVQHCNRCIQSRRWPLLHALQMNKPRLTLDEASAAQSTALHDFLELCRMGRISPIPLSKFVQNRIEYTRACEAVWEAYFIAQADTGLQVLRNE